MHSEKKVNEYSKNVSLETFYEKILKQLNFLFTIVYIFHKSYVKIFLK